MTAPRGRPTVYTPEIAERICRELTEGRSLREVCRPDDMPHESTVRHWVVHEDPERPDFVTQYTQARMAGYARMADELLEISDDGTNDFMRRQQGDDEIEVANHEHISRSKLRVDTRKWLLSKALPKIYGDKVTQVHEGGEKPVQVEDAGDMRDLARKVAFLLARGTVDAG